MEGNPKVWRQSGEGRKGPCRQHRGYLAVAFAVKPLLTGHRQEGKESWQHWVNGPRVQGPAPHSS